MPQQEPCDVPEAVSQSTSLVSQTLYSVEEVNSFLDESFGKQIVKYFYPDEEKFERSVVGFDFLMEKNTFP